MAGLFFATDAQVCTDDNREANIIATDGTNGISLRRIFWNTDEEDDADLGRFIYLNLNLLDCIRLIGFINPKNPFVNLIHPNTDSLPDPPQVDLSCVFFQKRCRSATII